MSNINRLGFGAWQLANQEWGLQREDEAIELVKKAYQSGIKFFDTAPNYSKSKSESILGIALKDFRNDVFISTKFGRHPDESVNFDENLIEQSINDSLKRLQTSYLDSVVIHNPPLWVLEGKGRHFDILESLKQKGIIKHYGASIDTSYELETLMKYTKSDTAEILFNIFFQDTRHSFDEAKRKSMILIVKVPLDSGWLTGKYDEESLFSGVRMRWSHEQIVERSHLVNKIKLLTKDQDLTKYAMGFIWSYDAISYIIPGIKNEKQLHSHVEIATFRFSKDLKNKFEELYDKDIEKRKLQW